MHYTFLTTSIGKILIGTTERGICEVHVRGGQASDRRFHNSRDTILNSTSVRKKELSMVSPKSPLLMRTQKALSDYFSGRETSFSLPLDLQGTPFQKAVWKELLRIPYGKTRTYGEIAQRIGKPKAARAVGMACHRNPVGILVPCHRVIGANGELTGYAGGLKTKQTLLELEQRHGKGKING